jgi:hypothetical protein
MTTLARRLVGFFLLVTVFTATVGSAPLHGRAPHPEQSCISWNWAHQAKDLVAVSTQLPVVGLETTDEDPALPQPVSRVTLKVYSSRAPPLA